ncbi:MAG: hypothetical protein ACM3SY_04380 [Candidatus Omnitrophota bacterium]
MNKNHKFTLKIVLLLLVCLAGTIPSYALVFANDSPALYYMPSSTQSSTMGRESGLVGKEGSSDNMDNYVIESAGYFLTAHSSALQFTYMVELASREFAGFAAMSDVVNRMIDNMQSMLRVYATLTDVADHTPYNVAMMKRVAAFNYQDLGLQYNLNATILKDVKTYLVSGDARGIYKRIVFDANRIMTLLTKIKKLVDSETMPDISDVWQLNRYYSDLMQFGQCVAMVCNRMKM